MPGRVIKKSNDAEMRPDWTLIGYSDCPQTTLDGHAYAKNIVDTWDATITDRSYYYDKDYQLMYFPKNVDTTNITNSNYMFRNSNIEDIEIDLSSTTSTIYAFHNCYNLRNATIIFNPVITSLEHLFDTCYGLKSVELKDDNLPWSAANDILSNHYVTNIVSIFTNCINLKRFEGGSSDPDACKIANAQNAFNHCDDLEYLHVEFPNCSNLGCQYIGSDTSEGCQSIINIGQYSVNPVNFYCNNSRINKESQINIQKATTALEMFRGSYIDMEDSDIIIEASSSDYYTGISCERLFYGCSFPNGTSGIDIKSVSNAQQMFGACTFGTNECDITDITFGSNLTNYYKMFENCPTLHTITGINRAPLYGTNFTDMFLSTPNLDDATINDILYFLAHANAYTGTKTLYEVGFRSGDYSAARIQALPNYSDFTTAGWTIGY